MDIEQIAAALTESGDDVCPGCGVLVGEPCFPYPCDNSDTGYTCEGCGVSIGDDVYLCETCFADAPMLAWYTA